jgi:hypothetical protein
MIDHWYKTILADYFLPVLLPCTCAGKLSVKNSSNGLQYGFSIKAQLEFSTVKQTLPPRYKDSTTSFGNARLINQPFAHFKSKI